MKKWLSKNNHALVLVAVFCGGITTPVHGANATYTILETRDHDPSLFTQGLLVDGDELIESAGLYGHSKIVRYNTQTGHVTQSLNLPSFVFAEGLHQWNGSLYLLTWREGCAYQFDSTDLSVQQSFKLETEGWGLTHDGRHFIQSNGSSTLFFRNSSTFQIEKKIHVHEGAHRWKNLNELEYAQGLVWANVYMTSTVLAIFPTDGQVAFTLDLSALATQHKDGNASHVLNGIAYDPQRDAFWVTGKCWTQRYLIKISRPAKPIPVALFSGPPPSTTP